MLSVILLSGLVATSGMTATAGVTTNVGVITSIPSWTSYMTAVWNLDQASGATRTGDGSCGTTCNLSDNNTVSQSTSIKIEGTASADLTGSTNYLSCANATCGSSLGTASSGGTGGSISFGCWGYPTTASLLYKYQLLGRATAATGSPSTGYELDISGNLSSVPAIVTCIIDSTIATKSFTTPASSAWVHVGCVFNDSTNVLTPYTEGAAGTTASPTSITTNTADFYVGKIQSTSGANGGNDFAGNIDECFVVKGQALSSASMCRICSCGVDGSFCKTSSIDTSAWSDKGRNAMFCSSCTLPTSPQDTPY